MVRRFITTVENEDNWVYLLDKPFKPEGTHWCPDSMFRSTIRNGGDNPYINNMEEFQPPENDHTYAKSFKSRGVRKQGRRILKKKETPKVAEVIEMVDLTKDDEEDEVDSPNPINPMGKKVKVSSEEVARSENDKGNKDEEMDKAEENDIFQQSQKF